jgi:hypothetical protein
MKTSVIVPGIAAIYLILVFEELSRRQREDEINKISSEQNTVAK